MTTKHTPTPWNIDPKDDSIVRAGPAFVARAHTSLSTYDANATRIVQCVNACEGMADPVAEIAALRAAVQAARDQDALADRD